MRSNLKFCLLIPLLLWVLEKQPVASAQNPSEILVTVDQGLQTASLGLLRFEQNAFTFADAETTETRTLPGSDLVWWNKNIPVGRTGSIVRLKNGTLLRGEVSLVDLQRVQVKSKLWKAIELPRSDIRNLEIQIPANPRLRANQNAWLTESGTLTRILTNSGDSFAGILADSTAKRPAGLTLESNGQQLFFALDRVAAISFGDNNTNIAERKSNTTTYEISLSDGSVLRGSNITVFQDRVIAEYESHKIEFAQANTNATQSLAGEVCGIRNCDFNDSFLTAREPIEFKHTPMLGSETTYQIWEATGNNQRNFDTIGLRTGISMPSRSSLVFRIDEPSEEMRFQYGVHINSTNEDLGSVKYKVLVLDDNNQWQSIQESDISARNEIQFQEIETGRARAIALTVDYASNADIQDRLHWLMPRLSTHRAKR